MTLTGRVHEREKVKKINHGWTFVKCQQFELVDTQNKKSLRYKNKVRSIIWIMLSISIFTNVAFTTKSSFKIFLTHKRKRARIKALSVVGTKVPDDWLSLQGKSNHIVIWNFSFFNPFFRVRNSGHVQRWGLRSLKSLRGRGWERFFCGSLNFDEIYKSNKDLRIPCMSDQRKVSNTHILWRHASEYDTKLMWKIATFFALPNLLSISPIFFLSRVCA